jgi:hypothetical protein
MAYQSKDGKRKFENPEHGHAYDRSKMGGGHMGGGMPSAKAAPLNAEPTGMEPGQGTMEEPIENVVKAHGPAQQVEIHSHHQDGHIHKSMHHDGHSAAAHVHSAMGSMEQEKDESNPEWSNDMEAIPGEGKGDGRSHMSKQDY